MQQFRKLTADDVEVRVKSADKDGFMLLLYKNARVDQNILDETVGIFGWQDKYEEFKGNLYCSIGIKSNDNEWVWKSNCGTESNTEKEKGEASDAFKRAGFNWGIGRELYTCPKIKVKDKTKQDYKGRYVPIYYEMNVVELEVSDFPRKITKLKIIGKTMQGGYSEETIFEYGCKKAPTAKSNSIEKATSEQIEILKATYIGENFNKLLQFNKIKCIEDMPKSKAEQLINKIGGQK